MSPSKRQPSKQKRAAQNRAQRAALDRRREAATAASSAITGAGAGRPGGGLLSRLRGGGAGGGIRATAAEARGAQPVGYRAGLSALLMALAGVVFTFTFQVPVDADGETYTREKLSAAWATTAVRAAADSPDATPEELVAEIDEWTPGRGSDPIAVALWPLSLALLLPVIGTGIAFRAISQRRPSRTVSRALFATLLGALLSQIPFFFLPSVIALGIAVYQIRKAETTAAAEALGAEGAAGGSPGEVIDAEIVEDEPEDEDPSAVDDADELGTTSPDDRR